MDRRLKSRASGDEGFTLIELMVVVLIIGILVAIALPTFLGARVRAQDAAALSNLRNGIAAADTFFTDDDTYSGFNATAGSAEEPAISWTDENDVTAVSLGSVGIALGNDDEIVLIVQSASGSAYCYAKVVGATGSTAVGQYRGFEVPAASTVADASDCEAMGPLAW